MAIVQLSFPTKAYTPLEITFFLVHSFSCIAGKNLKSHQKHQPFSASHTFPKPSSITPLSEKGTHSPEGEARQLLSTA